MVIIAIESMERCYFFLRLIENLRDDHEFFFVTTEPLAHALVMFNGYRSVYVRNRPLFLTRNSISHGNEYCNFAIEVINEQITLTKAKRDAVVIEAEVSKILTRYRVSQCLIWNGQQLLGRAVTAACRTYGVQTVFLEISNLPSKLFADRCGINALSSIASEPTLLDSLPMPSEGMHEEWLGRYEEYKKSPLPQSRSQLGRKLVSAANLFLKIMGRGVALNMSNAFNFRNSAAGMIGSKNYSFTELTKIRYVFLPLQVSTDTQIKLHSDVNNLDAIRYAAGHASSLGALLLVKIHPAETDRVELSKIVDLSAELSFDIVSSSTIDLIKLALSIVTINSTVGLEALMYGKSIVTLGRCVYKEFDRDRLVKYIHSFLVSDIDYFGRDPIAAPAARKILKLA